MKSRKLEKLSTFLLRKMEFEKRGFLPIFQTIFYIRKLSQMKHSLAILFVLLLVACSNQKKNELVEQVKEVTQDTLVNPMSKNFKIKGKDLKQLIKPMGACYATDKITVDGELVDYMYREKPDSDVDSGWRFFSGTETQEYADNPNNWAIYDCNTIANYDNAIIPYLHLPIGTELERVSGTKKFQVIN